MKQSQALDILKLGKNVFLTGAAGSGKTYVLNQYISYLRKHSVNIAVTASTGIAATHLGGSTIHSWSGIGVLNKLDQEDFEKIVSNKRVRKNVVNSNVLIIDEISMLHAIQLDMVELIARSLNDFEKPFGGLQVILCGDFFQLPPVSKNSHSSKSKFAFESLAWEEGGFEVCYIEEQFRQSDDGLLEILNDIRSGTAGEKTKIPLRTRYKKAPQDENGKELEASLLYAKNVNIDAINAKELESLDGENECFTMTSKGFKARVESLKRFCLAPEKLNLKVGAKVMFVKNDQSARYVNGSLGFVESFDDDSGYPIVKLENGRKVYAEPEEWTFEEDGAVMAKISQLPLRLAWAITIHKSQGMTLDAAEIDLSDAFEPGMGYVALSRVRSLAGLKLMGLNEIALKVNSTVLEFDSILKAKSKGAVKDLDSTNVDIVSKQQEIVLVDKLEGDLEEVNPTKVKKQGKKKNQKESTIDVTAKLLEEGKTVSEIAEDRGLKAGTIIGHLEKLKSADKLPEIEYLKDSIPSHDFNIIKDRLAESEDGKLSPIFKEFDERYSYETLQLVRLFCV